MRWLEGEGEEELACWDAGNFDGDVKANGAATGEVDGGEWVEVDGRRK